MGDKTENNETTNLSHHNLSRGWYSRGYLLHYDDDTFTQSITIRLADSIPPKIIDHWIDDLDHCPDRERNSEVRKRIEEYLDKGKGNAWLRDPSVADIVQNALVHYHGEKYILHAWVVMSNHVHFLIAPNKGCSLEEIIHSLKSFTASKANKVLRRKGEFWQREFFDRFIRDEGHYKRVIRYIEMNPVNAGLCGRAEDWQFSSAGMKTGGD